ncbi:MAG: hypothetical protein ABW000_20650 [Actinoplanes sp.]
MWWLIGWPITLLAAVYAAPGAAMAHRVQIAMARQARRSGYNDRDPEQLDLKLRPPWGIGLQLGLLLITRAAAPSGSRTALLVVQYVLLTIALVDAVVLYTSVEERVRSTAVFWCLAHPRRYRAYARVGLSLQPALIRRVAPHLTPDQVRALGLPGSDRVLEPLATALGPRPRPDFAAETFVTAIWTRPFAMVKLAATADKTCTGTAEQQDRWLRLLAFDGNGPLPGEPLVRGTYTRDHVLTVEQVAELDGVEYPAFRVAYAALSSVMARTFPTRARPEVAATTSAFLVALARLIATHSAGRRPGWRDIAVLLAVDRVWLLKLCREQANPASQVDRTVRRWRELVLPMVELIERLDPDGSRGLPPGGLWCDAGFALAEAEELIGSGQVPDEDTLSTMAALRDSPY